MKTAVVCFSERTENTRLDKITDFITLVNGLTLYVDEIRVIAPDDENAFASVLTGEYDCVFVIEKDTAKFNAVSTVTAKFGKEFDGNFCFGEKLVAFVPTDFKNGFAEELSSALSKKFGINAECVVFRLYGVEKQKIQAVTDGISAEYPCVFFNTSTLDGNSKTTMIYGENAKKMSVDKSIRAFITAFKDKIYAEDDITLEQRLNDVLRLRRRKICTAESMTGGLIASKIVSVSGASDLFYEGLVTYDTLSKERRLGVNHVTVAQKTVVSSEVAFEMAKGLLNGKNCSVAISVTGYAGSEVNPSDDGLCFIGIGVDDEVKVYKFVFKGTRNQKREKAANAALFLAIKAVESSDGK